MWDARTKTELIIEIWEKLDCESIGREELEAIKTGVGERFGPGAIPTPMQIARLLADEGAELRHAEIMELAVERSAESPYAPMFRNLIVTSSFNTALRSLRQLENLRKKFLTDGDKEGLKRARDLAIATRQELLARRTNTAQMREIADWFKIWLETPAMCESWIELRRASPDFKTRFGQSEE